MSPFIAERVLAGTAEELAQAGEAALAEERLDEAVRLFDLAEPGVVDPDRCAGGRWLAHMLAGDFDAAWRESDAIRRRGAPDPHRFWNGEDLRGKQVIVRCLHGFGDAVQMFRFLPRLQEQAAKLIVEVPPRMLEISPCFEGMGQVITWGEQAPRRPPEWDVQVEVMELPYLLRVNANALGPCDGYLRLPERELIAVRAVMGTRRRARVGVVWRSGYWNPSRSMSFGDLQPLLEIKDLEFWSLQGELDREPWKDLVGCRDVYECGDGILRLAAVVGEMDLVITVDTLAAHLAGVMGVPCWLMLQQRADWRWMCGREDSPWYPSLRLFRQTAAGDWAGLVRRVARELACWRGESEQGLLG